MRNIYKNSEELKGNTLKYGDIIIFNINNKIFNYTCHHSYLGEEYMKNNLVFKELQIINESSYITKHYGYNTVYNNNLHNYWPVCNNYDYEALTRLVIALFELCEKINSKNK